MDRDRRRQAESLRLEALARGTRLGRYEIDAAIGEGGPASVRGWVIARELRRGRVRVRLVEALARPRRSCSCIETERRRAVAKPRRMR
jgi:hypothetical protein